MNKYKFASFCKVNKVANIIIDDITEGFKLCFDNGVNINISIGEDWDENSDGDKEFYTEIQYKTDDELEIEKKNTIPIYGSDGSISKEFKQLTDFFYKNMQEKYQNPIPFQFGE